MLGPFLQESVIEFDLARLDQHLEIVVPTIKYSKNLLFRNLVAALKNKTAVGEELSIFTLCSHLFDPIDMREYAHLSEDRQDVILSAKRKEALSKWLQEELKSSTTRSIQSIPASITADERAYRSVYELLFSRQIAEAVKVALRAKLYDLALVLGQIAGAGANVEAAFPQQQKKIKSSGIPSRVGTDENTRDYIKEQLLIWKKQAIELNVQNDTKSVVSLNALKVWALLSGDVKFWTKEMYSGLDWKRAFGLFLWYVNGGWDSIEQALSNYISFFEASDSMPKPLPGYIERLVGAERAEKIKKVKSESKNDSLPFDISFHVINLYCDEQYPLEALVLPQNISEDISDARLPWILSQMFTRALKISQFSDSLIEEDIEADETIMPSLCADALTTSFATQLSQQGSWTEACYVAITLHSPYMREKHIKSILLKYMSLKFPSTSSVHRVLSSSEYVLSSEEMARMEFVTNKLKIPIEWVNETLLSLSKKTGDVLLEALALIDCGHVAKAHSLCTEKIAAKLLFDGKSFVLQKLIKEFEAAPKPEYDAGVFIYRDYLKMKTEAALLLNEPITVMKSKNDAKQVVAKYAPFVPKVQSLLNRAIKTNASVKENQEQKASLTHISEVMSKILHRFDRLSLVSGVNLLSLLF